jgi:hypothetical protein
LAEFSQPGRQVRAFGGKSGGHGGAPAQQACFVQ